MLAHILLFVLAGVLACLKSVGDEHGAALAAHTLGWMKIARAAYVPRAQASLLGEFAPSEICWIGVFPIGKRTLRELP